MFLFPTNPGPIRVWSESLDSNDTKCINEGLTHRLTLQHSLNDWVLAWPGVLNPDIQSLLFYSSLCTGHNDAMYGVTNICVWVRRKHKSARESIRVFERYCRDWKRASSSSQATKSGVAWYDHMQKSCLNNIVNLVPRIPHENGPI